MSWNYRIGKKRVRTPSGSTGDYYSILSVYYDKRGVPDGYSHVDASPGGTTLEELKDDLIKMLGALGLPPLDYAEERRKGIKYGRRKK